MSSPAQQDRLAGASEMISQWDYEDLTFRGGPLRASVQRAIERPLDALEIDFSIRDWSSIMVLKSSVTSPPVAGQIFIDGNGAFHRIRMVTSSDIAYTCLCTVSKDT